MQHPPPHITFKRELPYKSLYAASVSLLAFSVLTAIAVLAWFYSVADPWTWKSVLAIVSAGAGVVISALIWLSPGRPSLIAGISLMVGSLLRVGSVREWTWVSMALVVVTLMLLAPLVHALLRLPPAGGRR